MTRNFLAAPSHRTAGILATAIRDESGTLRMDRFVIGAGVVVLVGLALLGQWQGDGKPRAGDAASAATGTAAADGATIRRVSAVGQAVPEPPGPPEDVRRSGASPDFAERFVDRPHTEWEILDRERQAILAAEAAAAANSPAGAASPAEVLAAEDAAGEAAAGASGRPDGS